MEVVVAAVGAVEAVPLEGMVQIGTLLANTLLGLVQGERRAFLCKLLCKAFTPLPARNPWIATGRWGDQHFPLPQRVTWL